ncbi:Hypothetical protein SRAE_1000320400 [Strongyloides ratti]|uniref:Uncharacterized protein n=1 Tax=Strongyloides ratti TaxID=34506 RepID=A0A090L568_STRRB|nr:Hypothetical protein SRAE_1000320400 [Strongyloides ratti]CEF64951.1 Hypothetical protein SRAE_1000320400 [Strongyloides ratti]
MNYEYLPKPKAIKIKITSSYNKNLLKKSVIFSCSCENKTIKLWEDCNIQENNKVEFPKIKRYLREVDLTNIEEVNIYSIGDGTSFDILNCYFKNNTTINSLEISSHECSSFSSFSNFIQKIRFINTLSFSKLCFLNQPIPSDYILPVIKKIKKLNIIECKCTNFVNSKMIQNLFLQNEDLKELSIFSKCNNFKNELIKEMKNRENVCNGDKDKHNEYVLILSQTSDFDFEKEFSQYFSVDVYENYHLSSSFNDIICAAKFCDECNSHSTITLSYSKSSILPNCFVDTLC